MAVKLRHCHSGQLFNPRTLEIVSLGITIAFVHSQNFYRLKKKQSEKTTRIVTSAAMRRLQVWVC